MSVKIIAQQYILTSLNSVRDTLEDVLKITDTKKSSAKKVTPLASSGGVAKGLFDVEDEGGDDGLVGGMGTDDIMKYIQQNQAADDDDLDLF